MSNQVLYQEILTVTTFFQIRNIYCNITSYLDFTLYNCLSISFNFVLRVLMSFLKPSTSKFLLRSKSWYLWFISCKRFVILSVLSYKNKKKNCILLKGENIRWNIYMKVCCIKSHADAVNDFFVHCGYLDKYQLIMNK